MQMAKDITRDEFNRKYAKYSATGGANADNNADAASKVDPSQIRCFYNHELMQTCSARRTCLTAFRAAAAPPRTPRMTVF